MKTIIAAIALILATPALACQQPANVCGNDKTESLTERETPRDADGPWSGTAPPRDPKPEPPTDDGRF